MKTEKGKASVLGIGNALVDVINILENDTLLDQFGLPRGSMTLVDEKLSKKIFDSTGNNKREISSGGSAANTIHTLAELGVSCGFIGKVGNDVLGDSYRLEFEKKNIDTRLLISKKETGRVMSLVSPDSERTMATYLGAAADLKPGELNGKMFEGYDIFYVEGYLVQDHKLIEKAIDLARRAGMKVALDLASYNVVEANIEFLNRLLKDKVDIVFANEEEALSCTGKQPEEALTRLAALCETAVVKVGREGSLIQQGNTTVRTGIIPAKAIDTTGAGDAYAAGFLFGLINGYSLSKCGKLAALVSARVVEVMGAKIPDALWPGILKAVEDIT